MGDRSAIEWTDATWNPLRARHRDTGRIGWHCEHVSDGCRNCYAERTNLAGRSAFTGTRLPYKPGHLHAIYLDESVLLAPLRWRRPRMIFAGSMTDLFADFVTDAMLDRIFVVMALCPQHTFQVLTKRPQRMRAYLQALTCDAGSRYVRRLGWGAPDPRDSDRVLLLDEYQHWPLRNVWLGTSCENQATADARVPELLKTPATVRFVSAEPLLGPLGFLTEWLIEDVPPGEPWPCLDWIIVGGESGPHARPMHPDWARAIRDQCAAAGVEFFFKQWGAFAPEGTNAERWLWRPDGSCSPDPLTEGIGRHAREGFSVSYRCGKKPAGRRLDGIEHNGFPKRSGVADAAA